MLARVGVIGVGAMGMGIARSAQRGGFEVHARDVDPGRERLAREFNIQVHSSSKALAARVQACLIVVVDTAQIDDVLNAGDGLLAGLVPGTVVLLCSTIAPADTARFAQAVAARGGLFVDAPISGGPARAQAATMSMMLAGDAVVLERVRPLLESLSDKRFTIGRQPGDAAKAKLVNNLLAGIHLVASAEAMTLAARLGLDAQAMFDLIRVSSGQSWMFEDRMQRALAGDFAPRAQAHVITKDLTLVNQAAAAVGVELALGRVARDLMQATCEGGWRGEDDAAVLEYFRSRYMPG